MGEYSFSTTNSLQIGEAKYGETTLRLYHMCDFRPRCYMRYLCIEKEDSHGKAVLATLRYLLQDYSEGLPVDRSEMIEQDGILSAPYVEAICRGIFFEYNGKKRTRTPAGYVIGVDDDPDNYAVLIEHPALLKAATDLILRTFKQLTPCPVYLGFAGFVPAGTDLENPSSVPENENIKELKALKEAGYTVRHVFDSFGYAFDCERDEEELYIAFYSSGQRWSREKKAQIANEISLIPPNARKKTKPFFKSRKEQNEEMSFFSPFHVVNPNEIKNLKLVQIAEKTVETTNGRKIRITFKKNKTRIPTPDYDFTKEKDQRKIMYLFSQGEEFLVCADVINKKGEMILSLKIPTQFVRKRPCYCKYGMPENQCPPYTADDSCLLNCYKHYAERELARLNRLPHNPSIAISGIRVCAGSQKKLLLDKSIMGRIVQTMLSMFDRLPYQCFPPDEMSFVYISKEDREASPLDGIGPVLKNPLHIDVQHTAIPDVVKTIDTCPLSKYRSLPDKASDLQVFITCPRE